MTFLSVRHEPTRRQAVHSKVIDLDTGESIPRVIWANDETGRFRQFITDETGRMIVENDRIKSKVFKRRIKIVDENAVIDAFRK